MLDYTKLEKAELIDLLEQTKEALSTHAETLDDSILDDLWTVLTGERND